MEFFWLTAGFIAGFVVAWRLAKQFYKHILKDIIKESGFTDEELQRINARMKQIVEEEQGDPPRVDIKLEQHDNTFYAYRQDTDEFLAQAEDYATMIALIHKRMGNVTVLVDSSTIRKMPGYPSSEQQ